MEYRIPHYFEQFRCVAAECEDTCCAGWAIMIDEESLEKYQKMDGAFGNRLRNSIDWKEGSFLQYNHRCAFLNERNLCDLHMEAGEQMLCDTCKNYPRHMEEYEGLREGSLSLSCIEAAKIILGCKEPVQFITLEDDVEDEEYEDFDYLLFTKLMDARDVMIYMLQNRNWDIKTRMRLVLELADKMQTAIDEEKLFEIDEFFEKFDELSYLMEENTKEPQIGELEYCTSMRKTFRVFQKLEVLKVNWPERVKRAEFLLYGEGQRTYVSNRQRFHKSVGATSPHHEEWSIWLEQLMVYFVYVYFVGAVYDGKALSKMKSAIVTVLLIEELAVSVWLEKGEQLSFSDFVDIAHSVSREIEHSDINLTRMEKICDTLPNLKTEQLKGLLMF